MDLIPIAFNVFELLQDHYAKIEAFNVMTRRARAQAGMAPPPAVHGAVKGVNPNLKPETQAHRAAKTPVRNTQVKASPRPTPMLTPQTTPKVPSNMSTPGTFFTPGTTPNQTSQQDLRARLQRAI